MPSDINKKGAPPASAATLANTKKKDNPWGDLKEKLKDRTKELVMKYKIIRGSQHTMAIHLKLNKAVPVPEPTKEDTLSEAPPVDDKKKKK